MCAFTKTRFILCTLQARAKYFDDILTTHIQSLWKQYKAGYAPLALMHPSRLRPEQPVSLWPEPEALEPHVPPVRDKEVKTRLHREHRECVFVFKLYLLWCRTVCRQRSSAPSGLRLSSDTPLPVCSSPAAAAGLWPAASSELGLHSSRCGSAGWPPRLRHTNRLTLFY